MTESAPLWIAEVTIPLADVSELPRIEAALDPLALAISSFEIHGGREWRVQLLTAMPVTETEIARLLPYPWPLTVVPLADRNWVQESQQALSAIQLGRFFIGGTHETAPPPLGAIPLTIDAGLAFGTGRHETTAGCLRAMEELSARFQPRRALDVGCGSGILAMAMAHLWPNAEIVATDNDPIAVDVARENFTLNSLAHRITALVSHGYAARGLKRRGPYNLIAANILADPLCRLAPGLYRHLAPGGFAILSGLLTSQEAKVRKAQEQAGLRFFASYHHDDWVVLVVTRDTLFPLDGIAGSRSYCL